MNILWKIKEFADDGRMAVVCDGEEMTYKELDIMSDAFAAYLIDKYKEDRSPIVIYGNKDNLILVLMMAALKSGRAYIPLDVTYPYERVNTVIAEVQAKVVINFTDEDLGSITYCKDEILEIISKNRGRRVPEDYWVKDDENAYILFTSGSTGKPKGVQISSNNIDSFTSWFSKYLKMDESRETIMNQVSYSFDVSVIPIYIGLMHGKTLFSFSKDTLEDYKALFNALKISNIKYWVSTPALAEICTKDISFNSKLMKNLSCFCFAGEVLSKKLMADIMDRFEGVRIINGYGPTEGTVLLSAIDVTRKMVESPDAIPIGCPMDGAELKVVGKDNKELPEGEKGELVAIGKSISKGYFHNDEMTKKVFFKAELNGKPSRGYRTGDMAYFKDGIIHYCGRKDFQIKLNGFRIEIEDIENNLRRVDNVNNCVVLPVYKNGKISHLSSFVTLEKPNGLSSLRNSIIIKNELKRYIQSYMIPRNIKVIKEFPINTNGKIDRKKLLEEVR